MILYGRVVHRLGIWGQVRVTAVCQKTGRVVAEPHIGCGECGQGSARV